jgi:hypothetical protein
LLFFCSAFISVCGQSSINTGGNNIIHSTGSLNYSIGETFYQTGRNISQGIQQSYQIEIIRVAHDYEKTNINLIYACPNPTKNIITLQAPYNGTRDYTCKIYDNTGREIIRRNIISNEISVDLSAFMHGIYFLRVYCRDKEIKTFKIIKN